MSSRDLNLAHPQLKDFAIKLIEKAKNELGLKVIVTSVARQYEEQVALYAQGRQKLEEVNLLRKVAKMSPITQKENKVVTWTLASKHIIRLTDDDPTNDLSRAIDFGILDKNGKYVGDEKADTNGDNKSDYIQLGFLGNKIAKELGYPILWGGDFKTKKDYPHFEIIHHVGV